MGRGSVVRLGVGVGLPRHSEFLKPGTHSLEMYSSLLSNSNLVFSCGDKCQSGFGRCNSDQSSPQPNSTNIVSPIATDEPVPPPSPPTPAPNPSPPSKGPGVIAYFPNWGPDLLSYDLTGIDIINYAFVAPRSDGSLPAGDFSNGGLAFALNSVAKKKYPGLRTVFSVGGWTDSRWFSAIAGDPNKRTRFANDAARYMTENRFDGVDIDWWVWFWGGWIGEIGLFWSSQAVSGELTETCPIFVFRNREYPLGGGQDGNTQSPSDPKNFVLLLKAIRARIGSSALLTIAASADLSRYGDQITQIAQQLDVVNLMTYDFAGGWQGNANLNSPLDEQSKAMRAFANAGVPKEKLSMGLAFYGRGFTVSSAQNNGLGQRITGSPQIDGTSEWVRGRTKGGCGFLVRRCTDLASPSPSSQARRLGLVRPPPHDPHQRPSLPILRLDSHLSHQRP